MCPKLDVARTKLSTHCLIKPYRFDYSEGLKSEQVWISDIQ